MGAVVIGSKELTNLVSHCIKLATKCRLTSLPCLIFSLYGLKCVQVKYMQLNLFGKAVYLIKWGVSADQKENCIHYDGVHHVVLKKADPCRHR